MLKRSLPILLLLVPALALAHAGLVTAVPKPGSTVLFSPAEIRLTFSEAPLEGSTFRLEDARGQPAAGITPVIDGLELRAALARPLPFGAYTVRWQTVVADGELGGRFIFRVGLPVWVWLAGGAILLIAGGGLWLRRRSGRAGGSPASHALDARESGHDERPN